MKKLALSFSLLALVAASPAFAAPKVGETMPAFTATTTAGDTISNETFAGKNVVLEWTNHQCPFVVKHYGSGNMQATQETATADEAIWVSIVSSAPGKQGHITAEQAADLTTSRGAKPTHIILDESGDLGRLFEAKTTPHMFIGDEGNTLRYAGAIDSIPSASQSDIPQATNYVLAALTSINAGEDVAVDQSKPYGCAVKY